MLFHALPHRLCLDLRAQCLVGKVLGGCSVQPAISLDRFKRRDLVVVRPREIVTAPGRVDPLCDVLRVAQGPVVVAHFGESLGIGFSVVTLAVGAPVPKPPHHAVDELTKPATERLPRGQAEVVWKLKLSGAHIC